MKLSHDVGRGVVASPHGNTEVDNAFLTDSGVKQMNRLKISSYGRKKVKVKSKVKPKKMGLAGLDRMELLSPENHTEPLKSFNFDPNFDPKNEFDQKPARSKASIRAGMGFAPRGRGARRLVGRGSKAQGRKKGNMSGYSRGAGRQVRA